MKLGGWRDQFNTWDCAPHAHINYRHCMQTFLNNKAADKQKLI